MKLTAITLTAFIASAVALPMSFLLSPVLDKRSANALEPVYYAPKDGNDLAPFKRDFVPENDDEDGFVPIKVKRQGGDDFVPISGKRDGDDGFVPISGKRDGDDGFVPISGKRDDGVSPDVSLLTAGGKRDGSDVSLLTGGE